MSHIDELADCPTHGTPVERVDDPFVGGHDHDGEAVWFQRWRCILNHWFMWEVGREFPQAHGQTSPGP